MKNFERVIKGFVQSWLKHYFGKFHGNFFRFHFLKILESEISFQREIKKQ